MSASTGKGKILASGPTCWYYADMNLNAYQILLIGIGTCFYLFDTALILLNTGKKPSVPDTRVQDMYPEPSAYGKSVAYNKEKSRFSLFAKTASYLFISALIVWKVPGQLDSLVSALSPSPLARTLLFFAVFGLINMLIDIPFSLYFDFSIEKRYGFTTKTIGLFWADLAKTTLIGAFFGGLLLTALILFMQVLGSHFWVVFAIIASGLVIAISMLYTNLIVPLFNKLTPLQEGELADKIQALARELDFPVAGIFIMDASKRSKKANAFFSGFGKFKKIVLFDTLVTGFTPDEISAVLAHEIGHYRNKDTVKSVLSAVLHITLLSWLFSLVVYNDALSTSLGTQTLSIAVNLFAFFLLFQPVETVAGILLNTVSRAKETRADRFACASADPLAFAGALKKLSANNLSDLYPHPLYVAVHYSHPPLLARLDTVERATHVKQ